MSFSNVVFFFGKMERGIGLKLRNWFKATGKVTFWLLKLSIDSLYSEKSGDMFFYYSYGQVMSFLHREC